MSFEEMKERWNVIKTEALKHRKEVTIANAILIEEQGEGDYEDVYKFLESLNDDEFVGQLTAGVYLVEGEAWQAIHNGEMEYADLIKDAFDSLWLDDEVFEKYLKKVNE